MTNILAGYNFPSLESIRPYLERVGEGPTGKWARETARRLKCKVCVGYPEAESTVGQEEIGSKEKEQEKYYNSLLVVDENGEVLVNYRKSFLYYTDESWASEGNTERGFRDLTFGSRSSHEKVASTEDKNHVATSFGICMVRLFMPMLQKKKKKRHGEKEEKRANRMRWISR